jgi:hypothetical protein
MSGCIRMRSVEPAGSRRRVNWKELKRPPGNIRRPPGLEIVCFRNGPVRPGYGRLALASEGREPKLLFDRRNKELVAARTHNTALSGESACSCRRVHSWIGFHSTSRITLRRFIRSRACTTSFLSSTARRCSTVLVASRGPRSIYSPRMRLASSTARISVSWSGLFMTARNSTEGESSGGRRIRSGDALSQDHRSLASFRLPQ